MGIGQIDIPATGPYREEGGVPLPARTALPELPLHFLDLSELCGYFGLQRNSIQRRRQRWRSRRSGPTAQVFES
jgi:hypothetical protein